MTETSRRDRVGLGLIGLGPSWEQHYRETLGRLQNRLKIRLVYDPVEARARSVASELDAEVVGSLQQILARHSLQGLLVLDPGWCGSGVVSLVARCGKPAYLATPVLVHDLVMREILQGSPRHLDGHSLKADDQFMPELGLRFTPASCRLRELIATKLGPARNIVIDCNLTAAVTEIAALIDWCTNIMGQEPTILDRAAEGVSVLTELNIAFPSHSAPRSANPSEDRMAKLRQAAGDDSPLRIEITCEQGHATLSNRTQIAWKTSSETANESLNDERTETEILIDQFCRRALGGLNPVGRLSEFVRAIKLVQSIRHE